MHFQPNNDAGSRAQGLKLTPFIGDGDQRICFNCIFSNKSLKLTPFIGDGDYIYLQIDLLVYSLLFKTNPVYRGRRLVYPEILMEFSNNCLKLTPFIGDGDNFLFMFLYLYLSFCLKLTPFIGDGNKKVANYV